MLKHNNPIFKNINNTYGAHTAGNSPFYTSKKTEVPPTHEIYREFTELLKKRREMKQRLDILAMNLDNETKLFISGSARVNLIVEIHRVLFNTTDMTVGRCQYYTNIVDLDVLPTDYDGDALILNSMIKCRDEYLYTSANVSTKRKYYFGHSDQLQPYSRSV